MSWMFNSLLLLSLLIASSSALFPGAVPEDGDIRHIYPVVNIAIGLDTHHHSLTFLLGWLENLNYPKSRIIVEFYVLNTEDATSFQLKLWLNPVKKYYKDVKVIRETTNWMEDAFRSARLSKASRVFIMSGDTTPHDLWILQRLANEPKEVVLIPIFRSLGDTSNGDDIVSEGFLNGETVREQVYTAFLPLAINLTMIDSSYLTFNEENIPYYDGPRDPLSVFATSAFRMGIKMMVDHQINYGMYVNPGFELQNRRRVFRYHLADIIASGNELPIVSKYMKPFTVRSNKWNTDEIYLINLKRRPERLEKMKKIFKYLGINHTVVEAVDGRNLDELPAKYKNFKILDGYLDPIAKRPMKNGEIGCFLSHYRIWEEVVEKKYEKVIIFEDDLRFSLLGMESVYEVLEDLEASKKPWDLIYLGRKKQAKDQEELWVPHHRHLSTVGYSYWTLGYLLSASGAKKLIDAKPLEKLMPVDEFLPLMYGKHPEEKWNAQFPVRNLDAFTMYPLVVSPQFYTNDENYVSDTEDSSLAIDLTKPPVKEEL